MTTTESQGEGIFSRISVSVPSSMYHIGERKWNSRLDALLRSDTPIWPVVESWTRPKKWVDFVLVMRAFLRVLRFSSLHKKKN